MQGGSTKDLEKELASCAQLHTFLEQNEPAMLQRTVAQWLQLLLEEKSLSRSEVIARSGLNEIYAHQIFFGKRNPSRDKLICLCFGLGLDVEEMQLLLRACGYSNLYVKRRRESVILYARLKGLTLLQCNELLYDEEEPLLQ